MMKASIPAFAIPARSRASRASNVATGNSSAFQPINPRRMTLPFGARSFPKTGSHFSGSCSPRHAEQFARGGDAGLHRFTPQRVRALLLRRRFAHHQGPADLRIITIDAGRQLGRHHVAALELFAAWRRHAFDLDAADPDDLEIVV